MLDRLRRGVPGEEFSYSFLMSHLGEYKKPRDKVTRLLASGAIIRIKKGLYVFGELYRRSPLCPELLANLIYGPSYISLEYALAYYGMIPEAAYVVTSITLKRNKQFQTPAGLFTYQHLHPAKYPVGVVLATCDSTRAFLIATPEKALADLVASVTEITSTELMDSYLIDHMRVDPEAIEKLNFKHLEEIALAYQNRRVDLLQSVVLQIKAR